MKETIQYFNFKNKDFVEISEIDAILKIKFECAKNHYFAGSMVGAITFGAYEKSLVNGIIGGVLGGCFLGSFQHSKHYMINRITSAYNKDDAFKVLANLASDALVGLGVVAWNSGYKDIKFSCLAAIGGISTVALAYADLEHLAAEKLMANDDFMSFSYLLQN